MLAIILTAAVCVGSLWLLKRVQLAYFSQLTRIPNCHFIAPLSNLWTIINKWNDCENRARYEAHERLGPVIRIGPNELSINRIDDGVRTVYGPDFDKDAWYPHTFGPGDGTPCMFTMLPKKAHAERKRMLGNVYSRSYILNSPTLEGISNKVISHEFKAEVHAWARDGAIVDVMEKSKVCLMDLTTAWLFGLSNGTNFLQDSTAAKQFFKDFQQSIAGSFWRCEFHTTTRMLAFVGIHLVPRATKPSRHIIEHWTSALCEAAFKTTVEHTSADGSTDPTNHPTVYSQLRQSLERSNVRSEDMDPVLCQELLDHVVASHDITGVTMTWIMFELSQRPSWQSDLREELLKSAADDTAPAAHRIDSLPLLDAIMMETMRLRSSNPGPWPRRVPPRGCNIGSYANIPPGTVVSASTYTLHRNAAVFPEPEQWRPERWVDASDDQRKEMMRWFWAFGSGARMCNGNHFAIYTMKMMLAMLYAEFETDIVDNSGMEQLDAFVAGPVGGKLLLKFRHVGTRG